MAAIEGLGELHFHLVTSSPGSDDDDNDIDSELTMVLPTPTESGPGSVLAGFTAVTDQIYVQDMVTPDEQEKVDPSHPGTIMLFGWGDARPKHVAKYVEGYRALFPHARIVLVFSPILRALLADLDARTRNMEPVVSAVFPDGREPKNPRILAHVMSNTGGINYAATLNAHLRRFDGRVLGHDLAVLDSTPGSTDFFPNIGRWSRAMAIGAAAWLPVPYPVARAVAAGFLGLTTLAGWAVGRVSAADFSVGAVNDPAIASLDTRRLYLYSREDDIIAWHDIEAHAARAVERGFRVDAELFEGTPHVGHMRQYPERYWDAIAASWKRAVETQ